MKECLRCLQTKHKREFPKSSAHTDGLLPLCRVCRQRQVTAWRKKNKERLKEYRDKYLKDNVEKIRAQQRALYSKNRNRYENYHRKYLQTHPWMKFLGYIDVRCSQKSCASYPRYGGAGIERRISGPELKKLWFSCGAPRMKKPSIDRKDSKDHYTFSNCQFIEHRENMQKANRSRGAKK